MKNSLYAILVIALSFMFFSCNDQNTKTEVLNTDFTGKYTIYRIENGAEILNNNQYVEIVKKDNVYSLNRHTTGSELLENSINLNIENDTIFFENDIKKSTKIYINNGELYVYLEKRLIGIYKK